jgi:glycosyltransferase involved in cell wall biosynthesis
MDHSPVNGGASISLSELLRNINYQEYELSIICNSNTLISKYERLVSHAENLDLALFQHTTAGWWKFSLRGFKEYYLWMVGHFHSMKHIENLISKFQPDIVHLNSLTLVFYLKHINKMNIKTVIHVRESVVNGYFGIRKKIIKDAIEKYADHVIYICEDNMRSMRTKKGVVIYNPVNIQKFRENIGSNLRSTLKIDKNAPVILYVGGLRSINGPHILAKAFEKIIKHIPDIKILLPFTTYEHSNTMLSIFKRRVANYLGIYSSRQIIENEINRLNIKNNVIQSGYVDSIEEYFCITNIVVIPFVDPHFARPVMEAGAAMKPVVATDIGGIREIVVNNHNGLLCKKGSSADLADKIIMCFIDKKKMDDMGANNFNLAEEKFCAIKHAEAVSKLYSELLSRSSV